MLIPDVFQKHNYFPKGIIHIGAHLCEEKTIYNNVGCTDENIIWIEANPDKVKEVKQNMPTVKIYQTIISDETKENIDFYISNNFQSSSILPLGRHKVYHPDVFYTSSIKLNSYTLPDFLNYIGEDIHKYDTLMMDIQGAELHVLKGAKDIISNFNAIYLEVNTEEIYEGCGQLNELKEFLSLYDFKMVDINMTSCHWGDAFFIKLK